MGEIFNQDYYHVENEDQKPEFPYDPDIDDGIKTFITIFHYLYVIMFNLS